MKINRKCEYFKINDYHLNKYLKVKHYFYEKLQPVECMDEMLCKRGELAVLEIQSITTRGVFFFKFKISSVCLLLQDGMKECVNICSVSVATSLEFLSRFDCWTIVHYSICGKIYFP